MPPKHYFELHPHNDNDNNNNNNNNNDGGNNDENGSKSNKYRNSNIHGSNSYRNNNRHQQQQLPIRQAPGFCEFSIFLKKFEKKEILNFLILQFYQGLFKFSIFPKFSKKSS